MSQVCLKILLTRDYDIFFYTLYAIYMYVVPNNTFSLKELSENHIRIMACFAENDTALRLDLLVSSSLLPVTTSVRVISVIYIRFRAFVAVLVKQCYDKNERIELFKLLEL